MIQNIPALQLSPATPNTRQQSQLNTPTTGNNTNNDNVPTQIVQLIDNLSKEVTDNVFRMT